MENSILLMGKKGPIFGRARFRNSWFICWCSEIAHSHASPCLRFYGRISLRSYPKKTYVKRCGISNLLLKNSGPPPDSSYWLMMAGYTSVSRPIFGWIQPSSNRSSTQSTTSRRETWPRKTSTSCNTLSICTGAIS